MPARPDLIAKGLGTVLALVAPAGFSEGDRVLWLKVATQTLDGIPDDLLRRGIIHARLTCDHPSKVVPAIMDEIGLAWTARKRQASRTTPIEVEALPAPPEDDGEPFEPGLIRSMGADLRRMALGKGWLTQEEIDAAGVVEDRA